MGTWCKGLMNSIGLISYQTTVKATVKAEEICKVGDGKYLFIESKIWRGVVTGSYWVVEDYGVVPIIPTDCDSI